MIQFDVCCKAIDQNFDCGCDCCAIFFFVCLFITIYALAKDSQ